MEYIVNKTTFLVLKKVSILLQMLANDRSAVIPSKRLLDFNQPFLLIEGNRCVIIFRVCEESETLKIFAQGQIDQKEEIFHIMKGYEL